MCECCGNCSSTVEEKDIYLPELATITKSEMMTGTEIYMHLALDSGKELGHEPGQFLEISVAGIGEAPISISSSPTQSGFEMVIRNVGSLTMSL